MQPGVLRTLEFDRIVEAVRGFAVTPMGDERLARLQPSTDPETVARWLSATSETAAFIGKQGAFPLRAGEDLPAILGSLAVEGRPLEALRLLTLATFLRVRGRDAGGHSTRVRDLPAPRSGECADGLVQGRSGRGARQDRRVGRRRRPRQPGAAHRSGTSCAGSGPGCAARSSPTCAARTPRNTCRTRSSPSATAATCSS